MQLQVIQFKQIKDLSDSKTSLVGLSQGFTVAFKTNYEQLQPINLFLATALLLMFYSLRIFVSTVLYYEIMNRSVNLYK